MIELREREREIKIMVLDIENVEDLTLFKAYFRSKIMYIPILCIY